MPRMFAPMCRPITSSAPNRPKTAPDAPTTQTSGCDESDAHRPAEAAQQVERQETPVPEQRLEAAADHPQREHVQPDVQEAAVHDAAP